MAESDQATVQVLDWINATHAVSYRPETRLAGGFQSGTVLVRDPARGIAVLKFSADPGWAAVIEQAAPKIASLRAGGWPTPAWLFSGRTEAGWGYQVQEFVVGVHQDRVTNPWLDAVLPRSTATKTWRPSMGGIGPRSTLRLSSTDAPAMSRRSSSAVAKGQRSSVSQPS